jgi:hypothetical protein
LELHLELDELVALISVVVARRGVERVEDFWSLLGGSRLGFLNAVGGSDGGHWCRKKEIVVGGECD